MMIIYLFQLSKYLKTNFKQNKSRSKVISSTRKNAGYCATDPSWSDQ